MTDRSATPPDPDDARADAALREWGVAARAAAPMLAPQGVGRSKRRHWPAAVAAAVLVGILAGSLLLVRAYDRAPAAEGAPTATAGPTLTHASGPPPGTQVVTSGHLQIDVPSSWSINNQRCGTPQGNTALLGNGVIASCLAGRPEGISWTEFFGAAVVPKLADGTTDEKTVQGHDAEVRTGRFDDIPAATVYVGDARAGVLVVSPDRALVDQVAASVAYVAVDENGCEVDADYLPLADTPRSSVPGADTELIPGDPVGLVVCGYHDDLLASGATIPGSEVAAEVSMLRALPSGYSRIPNATRNGCPDGDPTEQLDSDLTGLAAWFAVRVQYSSGADLVLHVRLEHCGDLGVSNGAVSAQWSRELVDLALRSGYNTSFPMSVVAAP